MARSVVLGEETVADAISAPLLPTKGGCRIVEWLTGRSLTVRPPMFTGSVAEEVPREDGGVEDPAPDVEPAPGASGGVVVAPELPRPDDPIGDMMAGGRPGAPVELLDPNRPDGPPVEPGEFDPNPGRDVAPTVPATADVETFPDRDPDLDRVLTPNGVPGLFTSPLGQEEATASIGGPGAEERAGQGEASPALRPVASAQPGATRSGSDDRPQPPPLASNGRPAPMPRRRDGPRRSRASAAATST